ncbi:matrin 3-like 1.1 isoform X2 [Denticeps clupeoides]|uniref:matrin 3-like 1.1 isoform X2 n=1 Tax=Denticeps clupeoides TaxID=299321 RepID=UPI0010A4A089|nr:matrin-3-like isoform X2 [Denticeps clupeoides]
MSKNPYRGSPADYRKRHDAYDPDPYYARGGDVHRPSRSLSRGNFSRNVESQSARIESPLSLLTNCGLEPRDISLLAQVPEDLITVENLPSLLMQIKERKKPCHSSGPAQSIMSFFEPNISASAYGYERTRLSDSSESRLNPPSRPHQEEEEHWDDYCRYTEQPSTSHGSNSNYELGNRNPRGEERWYDAPPHSKTIPERQNSSSSSLPGYQREQRCVQFPSLLSLDKFPSIAEASDFHGRDPPSFPHLCSLCDQVVLSEKAWTTHINRAQHAGSQLRFLERYPEWDCRLGSARRNVRSPESQGNGRDAGEKRGQNQTKTTGAANVKAKPNLKKARKPKDGGKVVCVKFAASTLDEEYLKRLLGQFGLIIKMIMFPSMALVEMGSKDQAGDIVKYFASNPLDVKGGHVIFSEATAFNFLQSTQVVSFSPLPAGSGMSAEITAIAKKFGSVKNTLFLPSRGYVEMTDAENAKALVDSYTAKPLKLKGNLIQVTFSSEYDTLLTRSPDRNDKPQSNRSDQFPTRRSYSPRKRSYSPKSHSPTPRKQFRERRVSNEGRHASERQSNKPEDKKGRHRRRLSEEKKKSPSSSTQNLINRGSPMKQQSDQIGQSTGKKEMALLEVAVDLDSELEGVEVIGEIGDDIEHEALEQDNCTSNVTAETMDQKTTKETSASVCLRSNSIFSQEKASPRTHTPDTQDVSLLPREKLQKGTGEVKQDLEAEDKIQSQGLEIETDLPESLEACITLDEFEEATSSPEEAEESQKHAKGRVISFSNLPQADYSDNEFWRIVSGYGEVSCYLLKRPCCEGFIEMKCEDDARRAVNDLRSKDLVFHGCQLNIDLSSEHIINGCTPEANIEENNQEEKAAECSMASTTVCCMCSTSTASQLGLSSADTTRDNRLEQETSERPQNKGPSEISSNIKKVACVDEDTKQIKTEPKPEIEPYRPNNPLGREFVRPVVGYFCNLCDVIYASEEEAKNEHCSSLSHYQKWKAHITETKKSST